MNYRKEKTTRIELYEKLRKSINNEIVVIDSVLKNTDKILEFTKRLNTVDSDLFTSGNFFFNSTQKIKSENLLVTLKNKKILDALEEINENSLRRTQNNYNDFKKRYDYIVHAQSLQKFDDPIENAEDVDATFITKRSMEVQKELEQIKVPEISLKTTIQNKINDLKEIIDNSSLVEKEINNEKSIKEVEEYMEMGWEESTIEHNELSASIQEINKFEKENYSEVIKKQKNRNLFIMIGFIVSLTTLTFMLIFM